VAIEFVNPLTAGTVLVRSDVQSQNYHAGTDGWIIEADGNAEFNDLTIRGVFSGSNFTINSSGIFMYNGTPAAGNLIGSWTSASGTDSFGNNYNAGFAIYQGATTEYAIDTSGNLTVGPSSGAHFTFSVGASPTMKAFDSLGRQCLQLDSNTGLMTVLDNTDMNFMQLNTTTGQTPGGMVIGVLSTAGTMPTATQVANAAGVYNLNGSSLGLHSPIGVPAAATTYGGMFVTSGGSGKITGDPLVPSVSLYAIPQANNSAMDMHISGSVIKTTNTGLLYTWTGQSMQGGWASGPGAGGAYPPLQWRYDGEDNIHIFGTFHTTSTSPGSIVALGMPPVNQTTLGGVGVVGAMVRFQGAAGSISGYINNTGDFRLSNSLTYAVNDTFMVNAKVPIGNIS
jgi:hypothetical protein